MTAPQGLPIQFDADSVPYIGGPWATTDRGINANYRTLTAVDIDAAILGEIGEGSVLNGASAIDIGVFYALQYLTQTYGPIGGQLIDMTTGQPIIAAVGAPGKAIQYDALGVPYVDETSGSMIVPGDAGLVWLNRNFGKR